MATQTCFTSLPHMRYRVTVEQPKTDSGSENDYAEIDLTDDSNWTVYVQSRASVRNARGRERFMDDMTVATRNVMVEMWGTSKTRQISTRYRVKYTDEDGVLHTLGIVERTISDDRRIVKLACVEDAS